MDELSICERTWTKRTWINCDIMGWKAPEELFLHLVLQLFRQTDVSKVNNKHSISIN